MVDNTPRLIAALRDDGLAVDQPVSVADATRIVKLMFGQYNRTYYPTSKGGKFNKEKILAAVAQLESGENLRGFLIPADGTPVKAAHLNGAPPGKFVAHVDGISICFSSAGNFADPWRTVELTAVLDPQLLDDGGRTTPGGGHHAGNGGLAASANPDTALSARRPFGHRSSLLACALGVLVAVWCALLPLQRGVVLFRHPVSLSGGDPMSSMDVVAINLAPYRAVRPTAAAHIDELGANCLAAAVYEKRSARTDIERLTVAARILEPLGGSASSGAICQKVFNDAGAPINLRHVSDKRAWQRSKEIAAALVKSSSAPIEQANPDGYPVVPKALATPLHPYVVGHIGRHTFYRLPAMGAGTLAVDVPSDEAHKSLIILADVPARRAEGDTLIR